MTKSKNIYKNGAIANFSKKERVTTAATEKREVRNELQNFANSLDFAFKQLTATTSAARNAANAAKGTYKTAVAVVAACYPYQTAAGELCTRSKGAYKVRTLKGRAAAGAVVNAALKSYIDFRLGRKSALVEIVTAAE